MTLDLTKPVQTRDGRKVEIISTEGREPYSVIGYVPGNAAPSCWEKTGESYHGPTIDHAGKWNLINVPTKKSGWININDYKNGRSCSEHVYPDKEAAVLCRTISHVATIFIEWEE